MDAYGVGTALATGSGSPTAGLVYKLVARQDAAGAWIPVAKTSTAKASLGGRKTAFRILEHGIAREELIVVTEGFEHTETPTPPSNARALQVPLVAHGEIDAAAEGPGGVSAAREHHARVRAELPLTALALSRSEPALETAYQTG